jgi:hypothetical protein
MILKYKFGGKKQSVTLSYKLVIKTNTPDEFDIRKNKKKPQCWNCLERRVVRLHVFISTSFPSKPTLKQELNV